MSILKRAPIANYEGIYDITENGDVFSQPRKNCKNRRKIKQINHSDGYLFVNLYKGGKSKLFLVHRLVAAAFICDIKDGDNVNHKNGDKKDNRLSNLEVISIRENISHGKNGATGCYFNKTASKWHAQAKIGGVNHYIGLFNTQKEATAAYVCFLKDNGLQNRYIHTPGQK